MTLRRIPLLALLALLAACSSVESSAGGEVAQQSDDELERAIAADPILRDAVKAIESGHPWKATVALAPRLAQKKPATILVAARAASEWGGWTEVEKLLASQSWLDSSFAGEGRELLARAALDRNANDDALRHAEAALRRASGSADRGERQVYLARVLDRMDQADSAAALYRAAAKNLPLVSEWVLLRAAGSERDATRRAADLANVKAPAAKARVAWTEAQARERFGDIPGAIERYTALGARLTALRLRLASAGDDAARMRVKDSLIAFLRAGASRDDTRQAVQILDDAKLDLSAADQLVIARALASPGPLPRALAGFAAAHRAGLLRPDDRLQYALVLSRSGRSREAMAHLDSIREPGAVAARAAYQRARMVMTSSGGAAAIPALRRVADRFPAEAENASAALYLLADLSTDAGNEKAALAAYRELYTKYPRAPRADDARFRAAILDLVGGRPKVAALAFDSISTLYPNSNERTAARYWAGRAWARAGDQKKAAAAWESILADQPSSYYGIVSARRLKRDTWKPAAVADSFVTAPIVEGAFERAELLERLGMDVEARFEMEALEDAAATSRDLALSIADAFRDHGEGPKAIRIGTKLIDQGERDARVYRLAYPLIDREELERHSRANKLDPALVAGLIKQESSFHPGAVSVANARGLMQVLPSVGAEIARSLRYPVWSPSLLFDPDVNLQIGTSHLAAATRQYSDIVRVLAAYNAGGSRVERWSRKSSAADDVELFAEQIPFVETRDYVRIVQRNAEMYRALYGLR
ncbi:MAG TPA: transglycosylase SLT domain-containing protein [Gemmatimonadaceae bacterium]|nr:transglycosylase SLT domain-containing protein [Gemmatimonadaceae bacterium]